MTKDRPDTNVAQKIWFNLPWEPPPWRCRGECCYSRRPAPGCGGSGPWRKLRQLKHIYLKPDTFLFYKAGRWFWQLPPPDKFVQFNSQQKIKYFQSWNLSVVDWWLPGVDLLTKGTRPSCWYLVMFSSLLQASPVPASLSPNSQRWCFLQNSLNQGFLQFTCNHPVK